MPVIKVWCLPKMKEKQLNELHEKIVTAVVSVKELGLKDENDMTCLFPADMMKKGLGEEIIVEVTGLFATPQRTLDVQRHLAASLGTTVYAMFPKAMVECFIYSFMSEQSGFWTSNSIPRPSLHWAPRSH